MLFSLPEYVGTARSVANTYLDRRAIHLAPSLKLFRPSPHPRRAARITRPTGVTRFEQVFRPLEGEVAATEVVVGDLEALRRAFNQIAEQHATALVANWQEAVEAGVAGDKVIRGARPLTWDTFMDAIEQAPIAFNEDGEAAFRLAVGPEASRRLQGSPMSPAQASRWDSLLERKRGEFRARQRDRRIS